MSVFTSDWVKGFTDVRGIITNLVAALRWVSAAKGVVALRRRFKESEATEKEGADLIQDIMAKVHRSQHSGIFLGYVQLVFEQKRTLLFEGYHALTISAVFLSAIALAALLKPAVPQLAVLALALLPLFLVLCFVVRRFRRNLVRFEKAFETGLDKGMDEMP